MMNKGNTGYPTEDTGLLDEADGFSPGSTSKTTQSNHTNIFRSLAKNGRSASFSYQLSLLGLTCLAMAMGISLLQNGSAILKGDRYDLLLSSRKSPSPSRKTNSKYKKVQGIGYQIYTGGAPAYLNATSDNSKKERNPECVGLYSYGAMWTEDGEVLQCYIGNKDVEQDVWSRLQIMKDAVNKAYDNADHENSTLKIFIAPEFFWRGVDGAYLFEDESPADATVCGPVCQILKELESFVADERFENWFFLFGSIIATETISDNRTEFDSLFYNFAPVYKGYDPKETSYHGKRFLVPKRYISTSDFITPQRHLNLSKWQEVIELRNSTTHQATTVINPVYTRGKYDYDMWMDYKQELDGLGYTLLEFGWLMVDGLSISLEICLDHQLKTALNAYIADMTTGRHTRIPSSADGSLKYVKIPEYQAQIGIVSSAGMTLVPESLALTQHGAIFLQDGLSNATNHEYWSDQGCDLGLQFEGGTEAVTRRAFVSSTDVFFEHEAIQGYKRINLYPEETWKVHLKGIFSNQVYPPQLTVFDALDIASV